MSESNFIPDGKGIVQGDTRSMPDRGTGTGMTGIGVFDDGMSIDPDAINRIVGISGACKSDSMMEDESDDPTFGSNDGDD